MLLTLTNGSTLFPRGTVTVDNVGVNIEDFHGKQVIPLAQVKWIYYGNTTEDEMKVYNMMTRGKKKSYSDITNKTSDDLMKQMWR